MRSFIALVFTALAAAHPVLDYNIETSHGTSKQISANNGMLVRSKEFQSTSITNLSPAPNFSSSSGSDAIQGASEEQSRRTDSIINELKQSQPSEAVAELHSVMKDVL